jgi:hypothetical protein
MQKVRIVGAPAAAGGRMLASAFNYLQASVFQWTHDSTVVCLSAILCCIIISGAPPQAAAGGIGEGGSRGYTVQKGDTLTKIADRLGAPVHVIMEVGAPLPFSILLSFCIFFGESNRAAHRTNSTWSVDLGAVWCSLLQESASAPLSFPQHS